MRLMQNMGSSIIQTFKCTNLIYGPEYLTFMPKTGKPCLGMKESQSQRGQDFKKRAFWDTCCEDLSLEKVL